MKQLLFLLLLFLLHLYVHFFRECHLGSSDFMVQVSDRTNVNNPMERESFWIEKLNCYVRHGLNLREDS